MYTSNWWQAVFVQRFMCVQIFTDWLWEEINVVKIKKKNMEKWNRWLRVVVRAQLHLLNSWARNWLVSSSQFEIRLYQIDADVSVTLVLNYIHRHCQPNNDRLLFEKKISDCSNAIQIGFIYQQQIETILIDLIKNTSEPIAKPFLNHSISQLAQFFVTNRRKLHHQRAFGRSDQ